MEERLLTSISKITKTITVVPRLATAAAISGALIAISAGRIAMKQPLNSGKYIFSTEELLNPHFKDASALKNREDIRANFRSSLN